MIPTLRRPGAGHRKVSEDVTGHGPTRAIIPVPGLSGAAVFSLLGALAVVVAVVTPGVRDTARPVLVTLVAPLAVGLPVRWLLARGGVLTSRQWLEAPFVGVALIVVVLQNLVYVDIPISYTTLPLWVLIAALWVIWWWSGKLGSSFRRCPSSVFLAAVVVYGVQGLGLILVGASAYLGRAWGDEYNYTVLAQFLSQHPYSTDMTQVTYQPYLVPAILLKSDRIGQSVLHAFMAVSSVDDAKPLFEPVILLIAPLMMLGSYALARAVGLKRSRSFMAAAAAALMPAIAWIHLESFLSQALAVPLIVMYVASVGVLLRKVDYGQLAISALLAAAVTSIYTEFWLVVVGLTVVALCVSLWNGAAEGLNVRTIGWLVGCSIALLISPIVLIPAFAPLMGAIVGRVGLPVLANIYPWAYSLQGLARVWWGDYWVEGPPILVAMAIGWAIIATGLGFAGFLAYCTQDIVRGYLVLVAHHRFVRFRTEAWVATGLVMLPVVSLARDLDHPYQFYKLLLSVGPVLIVGIALLEPASRRWVILMGQRGRWREHLRMSNRCCAYLVLLAGIVGSIGTLQMAFRSTSSVPEVRYNAPYLTSLDAVAMQTELESIHGRDLLIETDPSTAMSQLVNGWAAYYARANNVRLVDVHENDTDLSAFPVNATSLDPSNLPDGSLVFWNRAASHGMDVDGPGVSTIWSEGPNSLSEVGAGSWALPIGSANPNGFDVSDGRPLMWIGPSSLTIETLAGSAGDIELGAKFILGPSADGSMRKLRVATDAGFQQDSLIDAGDHTLTIPVRAGHTVISLAGLDTVTRSVQPSGDPRPMLIGIQDWRMSFRSPT